MNSKMLLILSAILIIAFGGFALITKNSRVNPPHSNTIQESQNTSTPSQNTKQIGNSRYVEYSKTAFDQAVQTRRVLYFYANWCPVCRPADANFRANESKIPEDMVVIRVNYNDTDTDQEEKDLAKKYGITYQHTFVQIDAKGKEITQWNGGQIDELVTHIK